MSDTWFEDLFINEAKPALESKKGAPVENIYMRSAMVRKFCDAWMLEVSDKDTDDDIESKLSSVLDVWEFDTETTKDALGSYSICSTQSSVLSGDEVYVGVLRLKPGSHKMVSMPSNIAPLYAGVDLSNMPNPFNVNYVSSQIVGRVADASMSLSTSSVSRLIMPETWPAYCELRNGNSEPYLMSMTACPAKILLSKHFAEDNGRPLTNAYMFNSGSASRYTEEIVIAPKDMDAPFHLHKFTKMTAETIIGILENLADVTDRDYEYVLTLGTTNLNKLTEEQKEIAYAKGWSLA